ncbi:hypothetical protein [Streptomyces griseoruber]|uniref:hypothetical protein n=1 Tax=Streptomyces griseoruber TaxID=1943 RepID=UPI000AF7C578|nr:hypothetical protein [Streptomyces griseoruber]
MRSHGPEAAGEPALVVQDVAGEPDGSLAAGRPPSHGSREASRAGTSPPGGSFVAPLVKAAPAGPP